MAEESKGLWPSFIDALMRALSGAFISAAGWMMKENMDLKQKLNEAQDELVKLREVARRRGDPAERSRVRDKWKDPS